MPPPWFRSTPPPWWPAGEPWPPPDRRRWRRGRRFGRRLFVALTILTFLAISGIVNTLARLSGSTGAGGITRPLIVLAIGALVTVVVLRLLRRIAFPLGDIVDAARQVADGRFDVRIREWGPPPVRVVSRAFNDMAAQLGAHEQRRRNLLADIAHELRTPLSVIQGRLEGLLDGVYPRNDEVLGSLVDETRLLSRLVEDLRLLSHAEAGALTLCKEPTDLASLVQDVVSALQADAALQQTTLSCRVEEMPALDVDPARIRQVLSNLVSNALQHTRGGTVTVAATREPTAVVLQVADTGSGIPADQLPHIFDRFYRGDQSRGSGLGLTIARDLVRAHGGDIEAASTLGAGTILTVRLPVPA
jgi:signal transduction histidine kinase